MIIDQDLRENTVHHKGPIPVIKMVPLAHPQGFFMAPLNQEMKRRSVSQSSWGTAAWSQMLVCVVCPGKSEGALLKGTSLYCLDMEKDLSDLGLLVCHAPAWGSKVTAF